MEVRSVAILIILDVRIETDEYRSVGPVEHNQGGIGRSDPIGIIEIEDSRPCFLAVIHAANRLNRRAKTCRGVIQVEIKRIHI